MVIDTETKQFKIDLIFYVNYYKTLIKKKNVMILFVNSK